jgi:hypothetical protein
MNPELKPSNEGHEKNKTSPLEYVLWAALLTVGCIAIAVHYHPGALAYVVGGAIMALGIGVMVYQIKTGGDTNFLPWLIQFIAAGVFMAISLS